MGGGDMASYMGVPHSAIVRKKYEKNEGYMCVS